jgi:hypothetical protein
MINKNSSSIFLFFLLAVFGQDNEEILINTRKISSYFFSILIDESRAVVGS